jgi:hypothetical protein
MATSTEYAVFRMSADGTHGTTMSVENDNVPVEFHA